MKKILLCLVLFSFLIGCEIKHITFSGMLISKSGDRIYFKNMHPESRGFFNEVSFVSEERSLEFSLQDTKELYLVRDDIEESTNEKDIIKEKQKESIEIKTYK